MVIRNDGELRGWLQLGLALLVQTAAVVSFLWQMHIDLLWVKDTLKESKEDRRSLHEELNKWSNFNYRLETCERSMQQHLSEKQH